MIPSTLKPRGTWKADHEDNMLLKKNNLGAQVLGILLLHLRLRGVRSISPCPDLDVHYAGSLKTLGQVLQYEVVAQADNPILNLMSNGG